MATEPEELGLGPGEYQNIFLSNPLPMWIFDGETLRFLEVNEAAIEHYGYSREEFLTLTIRDIRENPEELDRFLALPKIRFRNAGIWRHRKKDGGIIDVEVISHDFEWRGRRARLVAANDVTERLRAERQIVEMNTNLESLVAERTRQLEIVNQELEAFSYSVSHDLRAPLRVIDGFGQALAEDYEKLLDGNGKKYLGRIRATTQRMGLLIDDLLTLARVSRRSVRREPVNLSELAAKVVAELREKDSERQVEVDIAPGMTAQADRGLVKIVLDNLLGNAWKFTGRKSVAHIAIRREGSSEPATFRVSDDGAGFDMQYAHKLFGAFQRLHTENDFTGTGIGLATVQRIVHLHGGRIWADAKTGAGANFYFILEPGDGNA
ncbi:MAG: sensor histidine kinase [Bacillota bacterium]